MINDCGLTGRLPGPDKPECRTGIVTDWQFAWQREWCRHWQRSWSTAVAGPGSCRPSNFKLVRLPSPLPPKFEDVWGFPCQCSGLLGLEAEQVSQCENQGENIATFDLKHHNGIEATKGYKIQVSICVQKLNKEISQWFHPIPFPHSSFEYWTVSCCPLGLPQTQSQSDKNAGGSCSRFS